MEQIVFFFNTIELLKKHTHQVIPFCIEHLQNEPSNFDAYFVNAPEIRDLNSNWKKIKSFRRFFINKDAMQKMDNLLEKEKPDIAHIHNLFNGISLSILPILRKHHIPVVITIHDTRFICPSSYFNLRGDFCRKCKKTFYINCILHRCYQNNYINSIMCAMEMFYKEHIFHYDPYISQYIFVSKKYKEIHSSKHLYFKEKGIVLYNFIPNLEHIIPNFIKGNYLFYYGRITVEKGIITLIKAMEKFPHIQLKVAGTGPLLNNLKEISPKNVIFLGFVSGEKLFNQVKNASFVIVPSEWEENNPLTIIESYAYGKPVIGSNIGGIPEIIEEGKTGFTFETFNCKSLETTIDKALHVSAKEYRLLSTNARSFADKYFNADKHFNSLMNIYNKAIQNYENI